MSEPTTQTMKSSTSEILLKKKGRPKGSKNKIKASDIDDPLSQKGNPMFNIKDAEPTGLTEEDLLSPPEDIPLTREEIEKQILEMEKKRFAHPPTNTQRAASAITPEDLALDAEIQSMSAAQELPDSVEPVKELVLTKEKHEVSFLSDVMDDYAPAKTLNELESQVFMAKQHHVNSIEADEKIIRYFTRGAFPVEVGFFMYKDIKVYIPGKRHSIKDRDNENIYGRLLGVKQ